LDSPVLFQQQKIREFEKKLKDTERERYILKKSHGHLQQGTEMKFKFIEKIVISGEEDVPYIRCFFERILLLAKIPIVISKD